MAIVQAYVPQKKNNISLPVYTELPEGFYEESSVFTIFSSMYRKAKKVNGFELMHHCDWCRGWVPGVPESNKINTLGNLSGRSGTVYNCARCGREVGFLGVVA